ncbi:MAG: hypothetical protein ABIR17_12440 [Pseudolysinimonas sp.]|uniref:hypothetical protein n=1 Tax=Pseudolysinimonas sp. TaxID=2680009 RepID=UPI0032653AF8
MDHVVGRRFRMRARIITAAVLTLAIAIVVGGGWAAASAVPAGGLLLAYVTAVIAVVTTALVLWRGTARLTAGLHALAVAHPDGVVFLGRRMPPVVSDLPAFMRAKGLTGVIGEGWYPALADYRGISAWSPGRHPRELVLVDWIEVGEVRAEHTRSVDGDSHLSVIVDVRPYVLPLTVEVGYAWGLVTMPLDAVDSADLVTTVNAQRP